MEGSSDRRPEVSGLERLVQETAQAWKRMSLYPAGHPARAGALNRPFELLRPLLAASSELAFGVAPEGLVTGGRKLTGPGALDLAQALYLRSVAVLRLREGLTLEELESFLGCLRRERGPAETATSFGDLLAEAGVTHVVAEPVDYSSVVLTEGEPGAPSPTSLWDRILFARLGGDAPAGDTSADLVLGWIRESLEAEGTSRRQSTEELALVLTEGVAAHFEEGADPGPQQARELAELLGALPDELRSTFLQMALARLTAPDGAAPGLEELASAASASEMLASLRRLRDSGHAFSERTLHLVRGLVAEASPARAEEETVRSESLARTLAAALADDAPGPPAVEDFILDLPEGDPLRGGWPARLEALRGSLAPLTLTQSLLSVALTLLESPALPADRLEGLLDRLVSLFDELVASGRVLPATALVQHLRGLRTGRGKRPGDPLDRTLERLAGTSTAATILRVLEGADEAAASQLAYLAEVLGPPIGRHLLLEMCETDDRSERRRAFDFLQGLGPRLVPEAVELLRDPRWYVVRNMLQVLQSSPDPSMLPAVRELTRHPEPRVRLDAAKLLVRHDPALSADSIARWLDDESSAVQEGVMAAVSRDRLRKAVGPLVELATRRLPLGGARHLRLRVLHCLGEIGDPAALPRIKRFFSALGPTVEERRAAFASLAGYPAAARASLLAKGLGSRDGVIRAICRRISGEEGDV